MQLLHLTDPDDIKRVLARVLTEYVGDNDIEMLFEYHHPRAPRTLTDLAERFDIDRTNVGRRIRSAMVKLRRVGLMPPAWDHKPVPAAA